MKRTFISFLFVFLAQIIVAQLKLNEASNANANTIADPNGNTPDWIELYNGGFSNVNLLGYGLSDNFNEPFKWQFPNTTISSNSFVTLFADASFVPNAVAHYETAVFPTSAWKYLIPDNLTATNWNQLNFDDAAWTDATLGIGYGDGDDQTTIQTQVYSIYVRSSFQFSDTSGLEQVILDIDYDDGFVAYLNGMEIARSGLAGIPPSWDELSADHEALMYQGQNPQSYLIDPIVWKNALQNGENVLAIEVHNSNLTSSDLSLIPFLTMGFRHQTQLFSGTVHPWFPYTSGSNLACNFKIDGTGESIYLFNPQGVLIDSLFVPDLDADFSYGRSSDGASTLAYFPTPTPNATNISSSSFIGYENTPQISVAGGMYDNAQTVSITNVSTTNGVIRYTTDGQTPSNTSPIYTSPISITSTTVLKARCFSSNTSLLPSQSATETYLINEQFTLPIISLTTDDVNLYGATGIFDNNQTDWKKPCHIAYFDTLGIKRFDTRASMKPDGGAGGSRTNPQHSITLEPSNSAFGDGKPIQYPLISDKAFIDEYHAFYLRNGSNMWNQYPQRDATMTRLLKGTHVGYQAYSPVIVFLNGAYFGVYELREKANEFYYEGNFGNNPDSLDLLSISYFYGPSILRTVKGSDDDFFAMHDFVTTYNPNAADYVEKCHDLIDLNNFADYMAAENWMANYDWIYNNMKISRMQTAGNRWRFALQDLELGLGIWSDFNSNLFDYLLTQNLPNPFQEIFVALMQNTEYRNYFINRYADLMNTKFQSESYTPVVNELYEQLLPEMPRQFERWTGDIAGGMQTYSNHRDLLLSQFGQRNAVVRNQIQSLFALNGQVNITLNANPPEAGYIQISTVIPEQLPWTGVYFDGVPVQITAVANPGYTFSHWSENSLISTTMENQFAIELNVNADGTFVANFTGDVEDNPITVSEIHYNPDPTIDGGNWIELYNASNDTVHIGGWQLQAADSYDAFTIPIKTQLHPKSYLVICENNALFHTRYPEVTNYLGSTEFSWENDQDSIIIRNGLGKRMIELAYQDDLPFRDCADGWGASLEHYPLNSDLNDSESWTCGCLNGSPGKAYEDCSGSIVINEVYYNSIVSPYYAGDWIELKNTSSNAIDLSGYVLKDEGNNAAYVIPNLVLEANAFAVFVNDSAAFKAKHPTVEIAGIFDFGLSAKTESIRLYNTEGTLVEALRYSGNLPWTTQPATSNKSLEFNSNGLFQNRYLFENWFAGCPDGSPGSEFQSCLQLEEDQNLVLYPNPSNSLIYFVFDNNDESGEDIAWRIIDPAGRLILENELKSSDTFLTGKIDVTSLANGLYYFQITKKERFVSKSFVKF